MQTPNFWYREGKSWQARLLSPLGLAWRAGGRMRSLFTQKAELPGPCCCVGNAVAGGGGKTPAVQMLARLLHQGGRKPGIVLKGYGGTLKGPVKVDVAIHDAHQLGDEALLHAALLPTFVARDRVAGARLAFESGCDAVLFDDGYQNPALAAARKLLVIDGDYGFGNGLVMPAGPLREPLRAALERADAVLLLDDDPRNLAALAPKSIPVFQARRSVQVNPELYFKPVVAFAGIAHPTGFFAALARKGIQLAATKGFADHHAFTEAELESLRALATAKGARLVTTAKDWMRLPAAMRAECTIVGLELELMPSDQAAMQNWLLSLWG